MAAAASQESMCIGTEMGQGGHEGQSGHARLPGGSWKGAAWVVAQFILGAPGKAPH